MNFQSDLRPGNGSWKVFGKGVSAGAVSLAFWFAKGDIGVSSNASEWFMRSKNVLECERVRECLESVWEGAFARLWALRPMDSS